MFSLSIVTSLCVSDLFNTYIFSSVLLLAVSVILLINYTVSHRQFTLGEEKGIHHAISLAHDTIYISKLKNKGCAIADLDFKAAFNFLSMDLAIKRIRRYYENSITIPIINCIPGREIPNKSLTLRQGDCPSSMWFGYRIDPLLIYLEKRLTGIPIHSLPCIGPIPKK